MPLPSLSIVDCCCIGLFFFFAFFRQPSRTLCHTHFPHSLSSCGLHCISTCLDCILLSRCVATHSHHLPLLFSRGYVAITTSLSRLLFYFLVDCLSSLFSIIVVSLSHSYSSQARRASLLHTCTTKLIIVYIMLRLLFVFALFFFQTVSHPVNSFSSFAIQHDVYEIAFVTLTDMINIESESFAYSYESSASGVCCHWTSIHSAFSILNVLGIVTMVCSRDGNGGLDVNGIGIGIGIKVSTGIRRRRHDARLMLRLRLGFAIGGRINLVLILVLVRVLVVTTNPSQDARPHAPQLARNHGLLAVRAVAVAVLAGAAGRAVRVERAVRAAR
jgi:hypothetical protein